MKINLHLHWKMVGVIYISLIVLNINLFSIPPILTTLIKDMGVNHVEAGSLMTSYVALSCGSHLLAGILGNRVGFKKIMEMGLLIVFSSSLLFTYVTTFIFMIALRGVSGIGSAFMRSPCIAYIISWPPLKKRPVE